MQAMSIEPDSTGAKEAPAQAKQQQAQQNNAPAQCQGAHETQETVPVGAGCAPDDVADEARFILEHVRISGHDPMEPRPEGPILPYIL